MSRKTYFRTKSTQEFSRRGNSIGLAIISTLNISSNFIQGSSSSGLVATFQASDLLSKLDRIIFSLLALKIKGLKFTKFTAVSSNFTKAKI